jgi:3-hydroxybutyryl-CoA dehydrogenase
MHIVVKSDAQQKQEFLLKGVPANVWVSFLDENAIIPGADAYFDLSFEEKGLAFPGITHKPIFVNAVIATGEDLPANCVRINAWDGFLNRELIEVASTGFQAETNAFSVLETLGWKYQLVPDVSGMIAARVIAMIINEAYFGLGDEISTKAEIDIAMKLGTNYPYGPFEWAEKIGLQKIYGLLKKLNIKDSRYTIASALENEILAR